MSERIDWTTTNGCTRCNEHGPFLPRGVFYNPEAFRDLHQAWHAIVAEMARPLVSLIYKLA